MLGRAPWICRARGRSRAGGGNQGRQLALTLSKEGGLALACQCCTTAFPALSSPKKGACGDTLEDCNDDLRPPATLAASMHGLNCSISVLSLSLSHHFLLLVIRALGLTLLSKHLPLICSPLTCQSYQTTFQMTPVRPPATRPASAARRGKNLPGRSPASSPLPLSPPTPLQVFVHSTNQFLLPLRALPLGSARFTCQTWDRVDLPLAT